CDSGEVKVMMLVRLVDVVAACGDGCDDGGVVRGVVMLVMAAAVGGGVRWRWGRGDGGDDEVDR
ncbi:hypothetical protein Tco_1231909, partial [Tanacetum coccineum]